MERNLDKGGLMIYSPSMLDSSITIAHSFIVHQAHMTFRHLNVSDLIVLITTFCRFLPNIRIHLHSHIELVISRFVYLPLFLLYATCPVKSVHNAYYECSTCLV